MALINVAIIEANTDNLEIAKVVLRRHADAQDKAVWDLA